MFYLENTMWLQTSSLWCMGWWTSDSKDWEAFVYW
jgi:hypothetical protein